MRNILICPIKAVIREIRDSTAWFVLCTSGEERLICSKNALELHFYDTIDRCHPYVFTEKMADLILSFVLSTPHDADIFICCDSGESRSPAIAAALIKYLGESDEAIWNSRDYHPNPLVYFICCKAFLSHKQIVGTLGTENKTAEANQNTLV